MALSLEELQELINSQEREHECLEFKEARNDFPLPKLIKYIAALANEGGGKLILGVTDKPPRRIVGTQSFKDTNGIKLELIQKLNLKIGMQEVHHSNGRILVFHIPSRLVGNPIQHEGAYWMRAGESLIPMTQDRLKKIFSEVETDFSAEICRKATMDLLDPVAIENLRIMWIRKSGNQALSTLSVGQLLADAELINEEGITHAALILLGTADALHRLLPQAEIVFEYRSTENSGASQQRIEFQHGFFLVFDELWRTINLRNDIQHFQDGFIIWDIPTFNEKVIREAVLNAVSHRDYRLRSSVFVRQFPRKIEVESPGGFPDGINPENILWHQNPRNRRITDVFVKCGLIERAGQGVNLMFETNIRQGKPRPDFYHSDSSQVFLTLVGEIQDPNFLRFLEKIGQERLCSFSIEDFLVLDLVHREQTISDRLQPHTKRLIEAGVLEKCGRGRGVRYFLSQRYYDFIERRGAYTRKRGLDRGTNKELLLAHIRHAKNGSRLQELAEVLPALSKIQVQKLLQELKSQGTIYKNGLTRGALWFSNSIAPK